MQVDLTAACFQARQVLIGRPNEIANMILLDNIITIYEQQRILKSARNVNK